MSAAGARGGSGAGRSKDRLRDIETRWSALQGPPRAALDHLYRTYGNAVRSYVRGRIARGDFLPLRPDDADDLVQDLFLRLGESDWLSRPDRRRGRFRPYFVGRIVYFLRERRAAALGRPAVVTGGDAEAAVEEVEAADELSERLEREWKAAIVRACLHRIGLENPTFRRVLDADLRRDTETDAELAARLSMTTAAFRSALKRARARFREVFRDEAEGLDGEDVRGADGP